jgi:hypothetical protein
MESLTGLDYWNGPGKVHLFPFQASRWKNTTWMHSSLRLDLPKNVLIVESVLAGEIDRDLSP